MASPRARVIRTSNKSKASIFVEDNAVSITGDDQHLIVVDDRGTTIKGPVSIVADGGDIRTGGLFVGMSDWLNMIPSTMVTPIPQRIPYPPIFALQNIATDLAFFMALLV